MKVMHVIHGFNTGGAETLVKQYVIGINKEEFDIVVLCFEHHDESPYEKEIENSGVSLEEFYLNVIGNNEEDEDEEA